ncbi:MAG TPA: hypothetical protein VFZ33_10825 [Chitinophagaceae bacterium]
MIHVERHPEPGIFRSEKLLKEFKAAEGFYSQPKEKRRQQRFEFKVYINKEIKEALINNFQNKCAYCETPISLANSVEIELFRPKAGARGTKTVDHDHYWWLCYEWRNFYLSCTFCARKKKNFFPVDGERAKVGAPYEEVVKEKSWLVDPCIDDPGEHISFDERGFAIPVSRKGEATIEMFDLNRPDLKSARRAAVRKIQKAMLDFEHELNSYQKIKKNKDVRRGTSSKKKIKR